MEAFPGLANVPVKSEPDAVQEHQKQVERDQRIAELEVWS